MKLKIYKLKGQQQGTALLQDVAYFEKTSVSPVPQYRWRFMIDLGDTAFMHDKWSKTEITAGTEIVGFITQVTGNFYPEDQGNFETDELIGKASRIVWGPRKTAGKTKDTILRFLPLELGTTIKYALHDSLDQLFSGFTEVTVFFEKKQKLMDFIISKGIPHTVCKEHVSLKLHAESLRLLQEDVKLEFERVGLETFNL